MSLMYVESRQGQGPENGFRASLNYFAINISNYIAQLSPQVLIDNPGLFPGAVTRATPSAQDQQAGYLGVITAVDDIFYNYGNIDVGGINLDLSKRLDTALGKFTPSLSVVDMVRYRSALTPGAESISYLSQATLFGPGFAPRWKGTVSLGWELGPLSSVLTGRYVGAYKDYQDIVPNTNVLGKSWFSDMNFRYDLSKANSGDASWYRHSYVEVGAVNIFDNLPKFSYLFNYDYAQSDIRGRFVYMQLGLRL
jgi:iron complex outermembrane recepter protein